MEEETTVTEVTETITETGESETGTTTTTVVAWTPETVSHISADLDLIAGLLFTFMIIELCKWSYRFLNIFFPTRF